MTTTLETRRKLRETWRGKRLTKEHRENVGIGRKKYFKRKRADEARNKVWLEKGGTGKETPLENLIRKREKGRKETGLESLMRKMHRDREELKK
ncbi:hypothetical protein ES703_49581 [subsurface metagenome]